MQSRRKQRLARQPSFWGGHETGSPAAAQAQRLPATGLPAEISPGTAIVPFTDAPEFSAGAPIDSRFTSPSGVLTSSSDSSPGAAATFLRLLGPGSFPLDFLLLFVGLREARRATCALYVRRYSSQTSKSRPRSTSSTVIGARVWPCSFSTSSHHPNLAS